MKFSDEERNGVYRAIYERRDVRSRFLPDPVPEALLERLLDAAHHAPSVGFMQPWDFILIRDLQIRRAIQESFLRCNQRAAELYQGEQRRLYDSLTLAAILEAPLNLCISCDHSRRTGHGLGRQTIPDTDIYSTVCAVQNFWLAARAENLGVGWVSILDRAELSAALGLPEGVEPIAYLCVGYVSEFGAQPDLEVKGWAKRESLAKLIHYDRWGNQ
jgi:5,6-dimethylbenzimidazole synthase